VKVFLDTNVLVSAFATRGLCSDVLELVLLEQELVLGREVLQELTKALRTKLRLPATRAEEILEFVSGEAAQIVEEATAAVAQTDPQDARVLGEALAARAHLFVTGDAALLKLRAIEEVRIFSPRQFWEILHSGGK
jgi:putative PIN family toxin of toxin-antitoxin system